jgi:hypothetical protein
LRTDGALHGYQVDQEPVHSGDPGTLYFALILNGGEGLDNFNTQLDEDLKANPAARADFGTTIDTTGHATDSHFLLESGQRVRPARNAVLAQIESGLGSPF